MARVRLRHLLKAFGWIGLALVRREAPPTTSVAVGEHGLSGEIVELPFGQG